MKCALMLIIAIGISFAYSEKTLCQQLPNSSSSPLISFPQGALDKVQDKVLILNKNLIYQTEHFLEREMRREKRVQKKLYRIDTINAKKFSHLYPEQYATFSRHIQTDSGSRNGLLTGEYRPYIDSIEVLLKFLQRNPQLLAKTGQFSTLQRTLSQWQSLQARFQDADQIKQFVKDRRQQLQQFLSGHVAAADIVLKEFQSMNRDLYYYSAQVNQFKATLNDPSALELKALAAMRQLPAFNNFMRGSSQLAGLFNLPGNYSSPEFLQGLQTKDQVTQIIQHQVANGGANGASALQANLQSAESQLNTFKDKLNRLGAGSGDLDMPNFKPNDQKAKTFWKRLEYGVNFQTSSSTSYYPTITDLGLSLGYRLGHSNIIGVGVSYKLGWGTGWNHIAFSSQGVGLRSYADILLKGTWCFSGGLEYNYQTSFTSIQQINHLDYWTPSGLAGITKSLSIKNRVFKKTKISLLWDFLSYQQIPKSQPILFRIGYSFN